MGIKNGKCTFCGDQVPRPAMDGGMNVGGDLATFCDEFCQDLFVKERDRKKNPSAGLRFRHVYRHRAPAEDDGNRSAVDEIERHGERQ